MTDNWEEEIKSDIKKVYYHIKHYMPLEYKDNYFYVDMLVKQIQSLLDKKAEECARNIFVDIGKCFTCNDMVSDYNSGRSDAFKQVMQIKAKYIKGESND